ncbi:MAG: hypothetical protein P0119_17205 [Nitrospira sp.]|nr:hypothetical protein [Nitrospira sp.]
MTNRDPNAVGKALQTMAKGQQDAEELVYDPHSGTLEVARKGEVIEDRDRVPATVMAREGFFC